MCLAGQGALMSDARRRQDRANADWYRRSCANYLAAVI